ncbi:MAG: MoaD/ThiS family protein [Immundisolibacteraceae bacterium]|nr:MoaD/ThiS family protein [Immundisolibacteraceae bacterium]
MKIEVLYFASLRERVGCDHELIEMARGSCVADVWQAGQAGQGGHALPGNSLCAINEEYAPLDAVVKDADRVAFFPPVTGG